MSRKIIDVTRARPSLAVDPKSDDGATGAWPERILAWDEDATTLAVEAGHALGPASRAVIGPGIDAETIRVALGLSETPLLSSDPLQSARALEEPIIALGMQNGDAIAARVEDAPTGTAEPAGPRDVSPSPRMVSALRALRESRRIPPSESIPDSPMGAYVPMGTWLEDLPARLRLIAQRCTACSRTMYPPRATCPACRARTFESVQLPREARVYALTRIGRGGAPSEFALEQAQTGAYWVAVIEWPDHGVRVTARLADVGDDAPAIGASVRAVVRRLFDQEGVTRYGVKFAPISDTR